MKQIIKPMLFVFLLMISLVSCNNEELFVENAIVEDTEEPSTPEDNNTGGEETAATPRVTTPCDFNLNNVAANATIIINCVLDLGGQSITLPAGVTLVYEGGDIINGTINFGSNNIISGELLNSSLSIAGTKPQMKDTTFNFDPQRWGIVEGKITDEVALNNTNILENLFFEVKKLGVKKFKLDYLDAYFKVDGLLGPQSGPETYAINLPSDFYLSMSNNTHLRMQPNGHFRAALLCAYNVSNVIVEGGILHGEREEHNYNSNFVDSDGSTGTTNEWVDIMRIKGGKNITIDGVTFQDAAGDCLNISGIYFYYDPRHIKSENIVIKNSKFLRARRTNLVITSGEQIVVDNNELIDGGIKMTKSTGIAPSSNLNLEPVRGRDATGAYIEYERVSHVFIRNNTQKVNDKVANPSAGQFQISHADGPIIIENNEMINTGVSFYTANGVIIRNNNIVQSGISAGAAENYDRTTVVYGNEVYSNTVVTNSTAINISGNGTLVRDNYFEGNIGAAFGAGATESSMGTSNTVFKNNIIKSGSRGISSMNTLKNVTIENNSIEMASGAPFALSLINAWSYQEDSNFIFKNNIITGGKVGTERGAPPSLISANSLTIEDNKIGELQFSGGKNVNVINNEIEAAIGQNGVLFNTNVLNTYFRKNKITIYPSKTPLNIKCVHVANNIVLTSVVFEEQECIEK